MNYRVHTLQSATLIVTLVNPVLLFITGVERISTKTADRKETNPNEFNTTEPRREKKWEKAMGHSLRRWKDLGPTTRHPTPKEQKKIDKKMKEDLKDFEDIITGPTH